MKGGHAAELGGPDDERVIEQSAGLEIGQERSRGLVEDRSVTVVVGLNAPMSVPVEDAFAHGEGTVEEGDKPHAPLQEAAGEQAVAAEGGHERIRAVEAVEGTRGRAFAREVADFGALCCIRPASS